MSRSRKLAVGSNQYHIRPATPDANGQDQQLLYQAIQQAALGGVQHQTPDQPPAAIVAIEDTDFDIDWDLVIDAMHASAPAGQVDMCRAIEGRLAAGEHIDPRPASALVEVICNREVGSQENWGAWLRRAVCVTLLTDSPHCLPDAAELCARWVLDPPVDQDILNKHTAQVLLRRFAQSASIPQWACQQLYERWPESWVCLASNPECPPHLLIRLVASNSEAARQAALHNPGLPDEYQALHTITR